MSDFTRQPLQTKLNKNNYISRIRKLERLKTANPSAQVGSLNQISGFAAGGASINNDGLVFISSIYPIQDQIDWRADNDNALLARLLGWYTDSGTLASGTYLIGYGKDATHKGTAGLAVYNFDETTLLVFDIDESGETILNLETATGTASGNQALTISTKVAVTAAGNTVLILSTKSSGTPAVGLGTFIAFRVQNAPQDEVLDAGDLGYVYEIATDDLEKTRLENFRLYAGASIRVPIHEPDYRWIQFVESDFITDNGGLEPIAIAAGGTVATQVGEADHPGIVTISSIATNNTGGIIRGITSETGANYLNPIMMGGGEVFYCVFRLGSVATQVVTILGYSDQVSVTAPTDGMWINIAAATLTGKTANNTTTSTTGTSYTVSTATWYRCVILVSTDAATVYFYLYNSATGALLWSDTLTTNIPSGRQTGYVSKAYRTNNVATDIIDVDYMSYYNVKQMAR